jgi:hypothetical protein
MTGFKPRYEARVEQGLKLKAPTFRRSPCIGTNKASKWTRLVWLLFLCDMRPLVKPPALWTLGYPWKD